MSLRIRHLSLHEIHLRQRAASDRELAVHNAGVVEQLQLERPPALARPGAAAIHAESAEPRPMRALTRAEYAALCNAAKSCGSGKTARAGSEGWKEAVGALFEHRRVTFVECHNHGVMLRHPVITPQGHEALKLWPILVERGLVDAGAAR